MSALTAPTQRPDGSTARQLRLLPSQPRRLARIPFLIVVGVIVALGMVGVVVLSVTIQQQGGRLDDLTAQADQLTDQQASLQSQLDTASSTTSLVRAAYAMGMRPNPTPAFIQLSTGRVIGTPTRVTGKEMGDQVPASVLQQASAIAAARAARATATPAASTKPSASANASTSAAASASATASASARASGSARASASATSTASAKASSTHGAPATRSTHTSTRGGR